MYSPVFWMPLKLWARASDHKTERQTQNKKVKRIPRRRGSVLSRQSFFLKTREDPKDKRGDDGDARQRFGEHQRGPKYYQGECGGHGTGEIDF